MVAGQLVSLQQIRGLEAAIQANGLDCDLQTRAAPTLAELVENTVAAEKASAVVIAAEPGSAGARSAAGLLDHAPVPTFVVAASRPLDGLRLEAETEDWPAMDERRAIKSLLRVGTL